MKVFAYLLLLVPLWFSCKTTNENSQEKTAASTAKPLQAKDSLLLTNKTIIKDLADAYELDSAKNILEKSALNTFTSPLSIGLYHYLDAYILDYQGKFKESIEAYQKAIQILEKNGMEEALELGWAYNDLGYVYNEVNIESEALKNYQKAYSLIWKHHKDKPREIASVANNYLGALEGYGNAKQIAKVRSETENYFEQVQHKHTELSDPELLDMYSIYYLGCVKSFSKAFDELSLEHYLQKTDSLFNRASKENREKYKLRWIYCYDYAGYAFLSNKYYGKALNCFNKMGELADNKRDRMKSASNFAAYYLQTKNYQQAENAYNKSLQLISEDPSDISYLMLQTARIWMICKQNNRQKEAKEQMEKMWRQLLPEKNDLSKVNQKELDEANSTRWMFIINVTAEVFRKYFEQNPNDRQAFEVALNMARLSAHMFQNYYLKEAFNNNLSEYLNANREEYLELMTYIPSEQLAENLNLLENNTSQHLWKNFLAKNTQNATLSSSMLAEQNQLRIAAIGDTSAVRKLNELDENINQQLSRYRENKFQPIDLEVIRKRLKPNEAVIRYIATQESVFGVLLSQNGIVLKKIGSLELLDRLTQKHYNHLTNIDKKYTLTAKELYQKLLQPFDLQSYEKLTIISEGKLLNIPFESLQKPDGSTFGLDKTIAYAHSFYFLNADAKDHQPPAKGLVAFAPKYEADFGALEHTNLEIEAVTNVMGGKKFANGKATKEAFLENLLSYNVQHLAMHATMDTADYEKSSLLFAKNDSLSFSEIYQLTIPAEMVTLSACNTGVGTLVKGEGLMSLSRALLYAGTKSVVHSLWRVPDEQTAQIMAYFYENLSNGQPKDVALQEAKNRFVEQNPLHQHPYFWTGFVLMGDTSSLGETASQSIWLYIFAAILVLSLLLYLILSKRLVAFSRQTD